MRKHLYVSKLSTLLDSVLNLFLLEKWLSSFCNIILKVFFCVNKVKRGWRKCTSISNVSENLSIKRRSEIKCQFHQPFGAKYNCFRLVFDVIYKMLIGLNQVYYCPKNGNSITIYTESGCGTSRYNESHDRE